MRLNPVLHTILAVLSGALVGYLGWVAYWNLDVIPSAAWPAIFSSSVAKAIHDISAELDVPLGITIKAMPLSIILGLIGGYLLPHFKFQRVYCYSVFLWPLFYFAFGYCVIWSLDAGHWPYTHVLRRSWGDHRIVAFAVYGWLFSGLYVGSVIARYNTTRQSTRTLASSRSHVR